jgi:hypothetical protein
MGITGGHKELTYQLLNLNIHELDKIVQFRMKNALDAKVQRRPRPTVDIDVSWVVRRYESVGINGVETLITISNVFANLGYDVVLICDSACRHHTKIDYIKRRVKLLQSQLTILQKRSQLMIISAQYQTTKDKTEQQKISEQEIQLSESLKRMEAKFSAEKIDVGHNLFEQIKSKVSIVNNATKINVGCIIVCQAQYQADSVIAY